MNGVQEETSVQHPGGEEIATLVSVIMPVYNESEHIAGALQSVLDNDHPESALEVLVVDGLSDDGTREIVESFCRRDPRVRLLDNPHRTVPYALNKGVQVASGDVLIRVDGHAEVSPGYIRACLDELEAHPECGCVGGPLRSVGETATAEAISQAMSSPFGVGNAPFRIGGEGYVDTLAFGAYRREVFDVVGRFDEELTRNQDGEFNYRLNQAGYRIWMSPRIQSRYKVRSSFGKLCRQYQQYGYWTVYVNRKHGNVTSPRKLVPAVFVVTLLVLALGAVALPVVRLGLVIFLASYLASALIFGLQKTWKPAGLARVLLSYGILHVSFGLGYLEGLVQFAFLRRAPDERKAELSR